jgi:outer membrane protein OmpA-like peptidoglycan-associated protein
MARLWRWAPPVAALLLSACASRNDLVVVLPESNGHVGAVVVQAGDSHTLLNTAYAAAAPGSGGTMQPVTVKPDDVQQIFAGALAAQPIPPKSYTLYFVSGSDVLVPESKADFEAVFAEISRRKAAEIVVTGHTDTMGARSFNDSLSLERAKAVAKLFIARGVPADSVTEAGRGERELLVQTADQVPEPRNRRVVITVR